MRYLAFNVHDVIAACTLSKFVVTGHARQRLGERRMCATDLVAAMAVDCEILETYSNRVPYGPAALVLSQTPHRRWLHAVCAYDDRGTLYILTAYEPEMPYWADERTRADREGDNQ